MAPRELRKTPARNLDFAAHHPYPNLQQPSIHDSSIFLHIIVIISRAAFSFVISPSGHKEQARMQKGLLHCGIFGALWGTMSILLSLSPSIIPDRAPGIRNQFEIGIRRSLCGIDDLPDAFQGVLEKGFAAG